MPQDNILVPVRDPDFADESLAAIAGWIAGKPKILVINIDRGIGIPLETAFRFPSTQYFRGVFRRVFPVWDRKMDAVSGIAVKGGLLFFRSHIKKWRC